MVTMAVHHRQVAAGAYERIARLCGMLCRLGVVLAILQLASWSVVYWDSFDQSEALASARHASRMQAVDDVVAPSVAMLIRSDTASRGDVNGSDVDTRPDCSASGSCGSASTKRMS